MFARLVARWATFVFRHPFLILIISLAIAIFSAYLGSNIALKSDFASLLPEDVQSVKDLKAISKRMGGMGTLIISVEGKNLKAMERFADDLVT